MGKKYENLIDITLLEEYTKYINDKISQSNDCVLEFESSLSFPTIGKTNTIYIDKQNDKSYRWDNDDLKYYSLNDYDNIEIIDGSY